MHHKIRCVIIPFTPFRILWLPLLFSKQSYSSFPHVFVPLLPSLPFRFPFPLFSKMRFLHLLRFFDFLFSLSCTLILPFLMFSSPSSQSSISHFLFIFPILFSCLSFVPAFLPFPSNLSPVSSSCFLPPLLSLHFCVYFSHSFLPPLLRVFLLQLAFPFSISPIHAFFFSQTAL